MNRDQAKALLPIIQAFADGKRIQYRADRANVWFDLTNPPNAMFDSGDEWRVKPEPIWRPWKPEEIPAFFMVKTPREFALHVARCYSGGSPLVFIDGDTFDAFDLKAYWLHVHEDGSETPCGIKE